MCSEPFHSDLPGEPRRLPGRRVGGLQRNAAGTSATQFSFRIDSAVEVPLAGLPVTIDNPTDYEIIDWREFGRPGAGRQHEPVTPTLHADTEPGLHRLHRNLECNGLAADILA